MKTTNNILSKIFFFLILAAGWGGGAWAQTDAFSFRSWDSGTFSRLTEYNTPICVSDNYTVTQAGHLKIQMSFKDGSWAFPALGVDLVNNATGDVKSYYLYRRLGSGNSCEYQISAIMPGNYTLRYWTLTRCDDGSQMQQNSAHPGQINIRFEGSTVSPTPTRTQLSRGEYRLANIAPKDIPAGLWNQIPETLRSNGQGLLYKDETCYLRAGHYTMTFAYSGPDSHGHNSRLELRGVELRDALGAVVNYDCHYGFSGGATQANSYSFDVPSAGTYTVRSIVLPENGTADCALCNGNVTYTYVPTEEPTPAGEAKWYTIKAKNNGSGYLSAGYADANGLLINNTTNPATVTSGNDAYKGIWKLNFENPDKNLSNASNTDRFQFVNANDQTKVLQINNPNGQSSARAVMENSSSAHATNSWFDHTVNGGNHYFRVHGTNYGFDQNSNHLAIWNNTAAFSSNGASQYQIEEIPNMGEDVTVTINAPAGTVIKYNTKCEAPSYADMQNVTMAAGTFNFHNMPFLESLFRLEGANSSKALSVNFNANTQTLTLSVVEDPNALTLSPAPTADGWAEGTKWFTIHNNRNSKGYLSTQDVGTYLDAQGTFTISNGTDARNNRGGLWAFIEQEGGGFNICNNAYGPDFILGVTGSGKNTRLSMYHKDQVPTGVYTLFTHGENNNRDGGATHAYYFRIGLTGTNHLNEQTSYAGTWDPNDNRMTTDPGSAFTVTAIADSHIDALPEYDVYTVLRKGAPDDCDVTYKTAASVFGRKGHAYNGSTIILAKDSPVTKEDFTSSNAAYTLQSVTVKNQDGHHCRLLEIRLRDLLATEVYRVVVKGVTTDNIVTYNGDEYHSGDPFYVRPTQVPAVFNFTILGAESNFVWGPVIDSRARTVTYDVRERAATLESGWYQMQLADDSYAQTVINQINEEDGNVNTRSHTVYAAPIYYDALNAQMKFTGVPRYGAEATTIVYLERLSATQLKLHTPSGAVLGAYNYRFENGQLKLAGWSVGTENPLENPVLSVSGSNYTLPFNLNAVDGKAYKIYQVTLTGDATANSAVNYTGASNQGAGAIYNNGYLFFPANGNAPRAEQFSVVGGNARVTTCTEGDLNEDTGIIPLTIELDAYTESWKVKITGYGLSGEEDQKYHAIYNGNNYANGSLIDVAVGTDIATAVKISCTDQFVWGPIVRRATSQNELNIVEFEIREAVSQLAAGKWYQMVLLDKKPSQVFNGSFQNNVPSLVDAVNSMDKLRQKSNYIYPITAGITNWTVELTGLTGSEMETKTYVYISKASASNVTMMMQNGKYVKNSGEGSDNANENLKLIYQSDHKAFKWDDKAIPWNNLSNSNKVGIGNTSSAVSGNMEFFMTEVRATAYKVEFDGITGGYVRYTGSAELLSDRNFVNNSYIFLKEGNSFELNGSDIDISNFMVRGSTATVTSITTSTANGITTLTIHGSAPNYDNVIVHKQNRYYDFLETDSNKPVAGFIKDGEGWTERTGTGGVKIREQNTSVFKIPVYLKQDTSINSYLPTNQLASYQRWYNYDTDGQVDTNVLTMSLDGYTEYKNGYAIFRGAQNGDGQATKPTLKLPADMEEYNVGLDISRFTDYYTGVTTNSAIEPSLGMRIVYQVRDAKKIANAIKTASDDGKFYEVHDIALPNVQYGFREKRLQDRTLSTTLPLDMDLNNYWGFNSDGTDNANLVQLTSDDQLRVELKGNSGIQHVMMIPGTASANSGNISRSKDQHPFNQGHFILFQYPNNGYIEPGATATVNIYMKSGTVEYKLVQFNLTFIASSNPVVITDLKNTSRHPDALAEEYGAPVAELTFDQTPNSEFSTSEGGVTYPDYKYPLNYKGASYAFGARNTNRSWAASRGEYSLQSVAGSSQQTDSPHLLYYPVANYLRSMANPNNAFEPKIDGAYELYIDAADQPGKIASIELNDPLCPGSRLYCYGYIGCTSGGTGQHPTSVLINVMGINANDEEELIFSYCPGIITLRGYAEDGRPVYSTLMGSSSSYLVRESADTKYWAPWQQVGFSFTISSDVAKRMKGYSVQIMNNAYNSNGGDTMLDDFQIYVKPPKGMVDFTTPLCSDKVRHAKIHADYDTLKELVAASESSDNKLAVSYCFLEADVFDNYTENGVSIKDVFESDDQGNHNLKVEMTTAIETLINNAFGAALVGSRRDQKMEPYREDHGFHAFDIPLVFTDIPKYAYNDSKNDVVYREEVNGVHRIVFKEDVQRGEMYREKDTDGHWYWPYLRPSTEYYLVFAPMKVDKDHITQHNVATKIFAMQNTCSFLGKFKTKDPMHVILDNAEIESDLPVRAVCYGETVKFEFDMPALKFDADMPRYPITDQAFCTSDESMNGEVVPSSQGLSHYRYEPMFNEDKEMLSKIKNMPYDWWLGGTIGGKTYGGTIEEYSAATHPSIVYNHDVKDPNYTHTHADNYKKHGEPVNIALAMENFRFFYPEFTEDDDWETLQVYDYDNESGYSLLQSEIKSIKDFVENGLLLLHRTSYNMPMTGKKAKSLTPDELSKMTSEELNSQILNLALTLHEGATFDHDKPLKDMEGKVLDLLTAEGRKTLTFQEFAGESFEQVKVMAKELLSDNKLTGYTEEQIDNAPESELRRDVEAVLRNMNEADLRKFAMKNFSDIGSVKRAHLLLRALNIMNEETLASMTPEQLKDAEKIREVLRGKMISIFNVLQADVLRKMWSDVSEKLKADEITALLRKEGNPATIQNPEEMEAAELSVLVEKALGVITNNIITDLNSDKYIHFTLVPIMPSQENFVDEPYIICPEPRGVKMRITSKAPRMFDGFADMPYPDKMDNVPVRIGLQQIDAVPYSDANDAKTLRIPLRRLSRAQEDGTLDQFEVNERGYGRYLFLVETNDPAYKREGATAAADGLTKAALLPVDDPKKDYPADEDDEFGRHHLIGMVSDLQASYDKEDNYMNILFNPDFKFREGYTYRVGFNFVESKRKTDAETGEVVTNPETGEVVYERNQSCFGTMLFDIKIVPEYQKWTGAVSNDWTNDRNWQRADRTDLHADNLPTGEVITGSTAFAKTSANDKEAAERYPTNADNKTAESFIPMAFTNTLIAEGASHMPALYRVDVPERSKKETVGEKEVTIPGHFLGEPKPKVEGVPNDDKTPAAPLKPTASVDAKYDMEVYDATGAWHTADNYECGLFGTYVAKGITFEPATSLYNAQLLNYQKAWVEYALNTKRWYTLASPLQETYSGEWYSPTGVLDDETPANHTAGRQLTPHFYGITYKTELNDRFNPAYYQRSWDKATVNLYQCEQESAIFGENPYNAYRALTWSKVYNDVQVDYTNGGFSVKTLLADEDESPEHASEYHEVLVRMPKEDAAFDYYDPANVHPGHNTPIARTAAHHRLNSDLLNTKTGLVQTLKNDNESEYYLVANPFIAPMDMDAFFTKNTQFESGKYWILSNDKQEANIKVEDEGGKWISTDGTASGDVAPLQAFFVKRTAKTKDAISVVYTAAMQVAPGNTPLPLKMRSVDNDDAPAAFTISNGESDALCYFAENASADYREGEDAELLLDSNLSDHVATVFTAASGQALHVNVLPQSVTTIPVGVIAPEDDTETVLTFTGVAHLEAVMPEQPHLYDAANGEFKPVEEGTEIAIEGTSSGRYYLVSGKHLPYTGIDSFADDADEDADLYNLHGIRVASPQKGNITIRGTRKEYHKR